MTTRKARVSRPVNGLVRCSEYEPSCDEYKGWQGCYHGKPHAHYSMCQTVCDYRGRTTKCLHTPNDKADFCERSVAG